MGHLVIRRGSKTSRAHFMKRARATLDAGLSILMFPEGTRSRNGKMGPFKPGAFLLARDTGYPILPVVISGTYEAMPPEHILLRNRIHAIFKVLEPVHVPPDADSDDIQRIMNELRDRMLQQKAPMDRESDTMVERWTLRLRRR